MSDLSSLAKSLSEAAKKGLLAAKQYDDGIYASPFEPIPSRLIEYQVWGRGDKLNENGLALRRHLLENGNG